MADKRRKPIVDPRAAERRRSLMMKVGAAVLLVAIAAAVGIWVVVSNKSSTGSSETPSVATGDAYRVSAAPAGTEPKVVVTLVEDFQCPACKAFETQFAGALEQLRSNPDVAIDYRPITFLDGQSTTQYSTRAANAAACVAQSTAGNGDWSTWLKFKDALYAQQPPEGGSGLPDDQLASIAQQAGAQNVSQCIRDRQFESWVSEGTKKALNSGIDSTPTVQIDGEKYQLTTPDALVQAVQDAVSKKQ
ncbi:DsbA family protein [Gordonia sinesedis]